MTHFRWAGGALGDFANATDWVDEATGMPGATAPGAQDSVDLSGGGAIGGSGTVAALNALPGSLFSLSATLSVGALSDLGRLTLDGGSLSAGSAVIDGAQGMQGALLAASAAITTHGLLSIGASGQAVAILNGCALTTGAGLVLGQGGASGNGLLQLAGSSWGDTGAVTIGGSGQGTLLISSSQAGFGSASIAGALQIGAAGAGTMVLTASSLGIAGQTTIGEAGQPQAGGSTLTVQGGAQWNGAHQIVGLSAGASGSQINALSIAGTGTAFTAGLLTVGRYAAAGVHGGAALSLGANPALTALTVAGGLTVDSGGHLAAYGLSLVQGGAAAPGLLVNGGTGSLTASVSQALVLAGQARATVENAGAVLSANGGISAQGGTLTIANGGNVESVGTTLHAALDMNNGAALLMQGGTLATTGMFSLDHAAAAGSTFTASNAVLVSAGLPPLGNPAGTVLVAIGAAGAQGQTGGLVSATLTASNWAIDGGLSVGAGGQGALSIGGGRTSVAGDLQIGSGAASASVSLSATDTIVSGGALAAGATGLSALTINLEGTGALLTAGALQIGTGPSRGQMTITGGQATIINTATVDGTLTLAGAGQLTAGAVTITSGSAILGQGTITASEIIDQGRIGVNGGTLSVQGPVNGTGVLSLRAGTLDLGQVAAASVGIVLGNAGTIVTPSIADLAGTIAGWQMGDVIDFTGMQIASASVSGGKLSLFDATHDLLGTLNFAGSPASHNFTLTSDHRGGTLLGFHI